MYVREPASQAKYRHMQPGVACLVVSPPTLILDLVEQDPHQAACRPCQSSEVLPKPF